MREMRYYMRELLVLYILEILTEYTNKDKRIHQEDILDLLYDRYQIDVGRKTLGKYISRLREAGYVKGARGVYRACRKNEFTDNELRVLIDSMLFAPYIPAKEADDIILKLKSLSPVSFKNKIRHIHYVQDFSRTENDELYCILDKIEEGIEKRKRISITVCRYNEHAVLEDVRTESIHPYYIVNSNSRYYVICYAGRGNRLESRRIDKISKVDILEESAVQLRDIIGERQSFDLGQYMKEHIYMFSGESVRIKIKLLKEHIGYFIDWYGTDYTIVEKDGNYITIRVKANENATYYWALQYGHLVEIIEPIHFREKVKQGLKEVLKKYD